MRRTRLVVVCGLATVPIAAAAVAAACSSFTSSDETPAPDGATADAPSGDAGSDGSPVQGACDPTKPFGAPTNVQGDVTSTHSDDAIWLLPGGHSAYFSSDRPDGGLAYRIFSAQRADVGSPWGSVAVEPAIDDAGVGRAPVVTRDGVTMYFFRGVGPAARIFVATRASDGGAFRDPIEAGAPLNASGRDLVTWVSADGSAVLLASDRNAGNLDVYRVQATPAGFSSPTAVTELNSTTDDVAIFTGDELQAFVGSARTPGDGGTGNTDLFYARRSSTTEPFSPPTPISELDTASPENPSWVSDDGCTLYFKRIDAFGQYKILVASRPK